MPIQRQTAKKVRIVDLTSGQFVRKEGMEPSFVQTTLGEKITRAKILVTIVNKFVAEDGNFASITVDDGSDTMRAKTFKTTKPIGDLEVGNLVDLIGKVREWNDEIYIIPEVVYKIQDPNIELLRRLEILKQFLKKEQPKEEGPKKEEEASSDDKEVLRRDVLKLIEESPDGIAFSDIFEKIKASEKQLEPVINELLAEGICYEPAPGKVKKI